MSNSRRLTEKTRPHASAFGSGCFALALASSLVVDDVSAQEKARPQAGAVRSDSNLDLARSVAVTGREAFNAGDYETALALFRRAYTLYPAPTVVLYEARALEKMGLLLEAVEAYDRTTHMPVNRGAPAQFAEALAAAEAEGRQLRASIPSLTIKAAGVSGDDPNLKISLDERPVGAEQVGSPWQLNPGRYRVLASVGPERIDQADVVLNRGQHATVVLDLAETAPPSGNFPGTDGVIESAPPSSAPPVPLLAYAAGGVGVVGIGSGVITGLMATGKHGEAEQNCPGGECIRGTDGFAAASSFRTLRTISTISYGVGAAGVAVGLLLWLTADDEEQPMGSIEPWGSANTAGIRGRF
jgi:hypothetical protein